MENTNQKNIPPNPFAFPSAETVEVEGEPGMTLRDYFAGKALPVTAAQMNEAVLNAQMLEERDIQEKMAAEQFRLAAGLAYKYADAMLAERAKATANSESK